MYPERGIARRSLGGSKKTIYWPMRRFLRCRTFIFDAARRRNGRAGLPNRLFVIQRTKEFRTYSADVLLPMYSPKRRPFNGWPPSFLLEHELGTPAALLEHEPLRALT